MSQAGNKIRHLLKRSRAAQHRRDCEGAFRSLLQAVRAYGYAVGAEQLDFHDQELSGDINAHIDEVFDGCIGR